MAGRVDRTDARSVEVEFRRGADVRELDVELDDGRVTAGVCVDD